MSGSEEPRRAEDGLPALLHEDLHTADDGGARGSGGERLSHGEATSRPLQPPAPEPQPRGAKLYHRKPVDHNEAAQRFIDAPRHAKMHDERLWDLRQKRDGQMHGLPEWEDLRELASTIKQHTLSNLGDYLEQFESQAKANASTSRKMPCSTTTWRSSSAVYNGIWGALERFSSRLRKSEK